MEDLVSFDKYSMLLFTLEILDSLHCTIVFACRHGRERSISVQLQDSLVYTSSYNFTKVMPLGGEVGQGHPGALLPSLLAPAPPPHPGALLPSGALGGAGARRLGSNAPGRKGGARRLGSNAPGWGGGTGARRLGSNAPGWGGGAGARRLGSNAPGWKGGG